MHWPPIKKDPEALIPQPHLVDYDKTCANFSWEAVKQELTGSQAGQGLNIAYQAVDRHANGPLSNHLALRWLGGNGSCLDFTYRDLQEQSNRFANLLRQLDIGKGDVVFCSTDKIPALYFAALGSWKNLSIFCPLSSEFNTEAIYRRMQHGDARILITTTRHYKRQVEGLRNRLPDLQHVLLTDAPDDIQEGLWSLPKHMAKVSSFFTIPPTDPEDIAMLHFTSGTTGMPKGALHSHNVVLTHYITGKYVLDLHPDDILWCTADLAWAAGTSYGIITPLVCGVTSITYAEKFAAERWYHILESQKVSVLYTSPTAIRRLMCADIKLMKSFDLHHLRAIHTVGQPLNPEAALWGQDNLGIPIHDNWGQTETGGIMIANYLALEIRPGSMGRPLPGITAVIVQIHDGELEIIEEPNVQGELALRSGWPSMFSGYLHEEETYRQCFRGDYYLTGDIVRRDADGYFWFVGRISDIIKTAGHMVSPFEVESVLMTHPAVAEAGVIGKPNALTGELVKAFVTLMPGITASELLRMELIDFTRRLLGPALAPREIEFKDHLPKNKAGKIMRRLLKSLEMGIPRGDISTLETSE